MIVVIYWPTFLHQQRDIENDRQRSRHMQKPRDVFLFSLLFIRFVEKRPAAAKSETE